MHLSQYSPGIILVWSFVVGAMPPAIAQKNALVGSRTSLKKHVELMRERATHFLMYGNANEVDMGRLEDSELIMVKVPLSEKPGTTTRKEVGCCALTNLAGAFHGNLHPPHDGSPVFAHHFLVTAAQGWPTSTELTVGETPGTFLYENGSESYRQENGEPSYIGSSTQGPRGKIEVAQSNPDEGYQSFQMKFGDRLDNLASLRVPSNRWPTDWLHTPFASLEQNIGGVWQKVQPHSEAGRTVIWMGAEQSRGQAEMELLTEILKLAGRRL